MRVCVTCNELMSQCTHPSGKHVLRYLRSASRLFFFLTIEVCHGFAPKSLPVFVRRGPDFVFVYVCAFMYAYSSTEVWLAIIYVT